MSRPPSATEGTLRGPLVTTANSLYDEDDHSAFESPRSRFRRHFSHDASLVNTALILPQSPRVASLKRTSSVSAGHKQSGESVYAPQLSERDSIFATHYLPSDADSSISASAVPNLPDNAPAAVATTATSDNDAPATPKAVVRRLPSSTRLNDDDVWVLFLGN